MHLCVCVPSPSPSPSEGVCVYVCANAHTGLPKCAGAVPRHRQDHIPFPSDLRCVCVCVPSPSSSPSPTEGVCIPADAHTGISRCAGAVPHQGQGHIPSFSDLGHLPTTILCIKPLLWVQLKPFP